MSRQETHHLPADAPCASGTRGREASPERGPCSPDQQEEPEPQSHLPSTYPRQGPSGAQSTVLAQAPAFGGRGARAGGRTGQAPASQRVQLRTTSGRRSEPAFKRSVFCKCTQITRVSLLVEFTGAHFSKSMIFSRTLRSWPKMTRLQMLSRTGTSN